jgi:PAS domain S-box-containing protein
MRDENKPKRQLVRELEELRQELLLCEQVRQHAQTLEQRVAERTAEPTAANAQLRQEVDERERAEAELERRLREATLMYQVSTLIASAADISEALHAVCTEMARFLGVPQAGFASLNPEHTSAELIADYHPPGSSGALGAIIPVAGNPSMVYILEHKAPLAFSDARTDPLLAPVHDLMRERNVRSMLIVPVIAEGEIIGTLGFDAFECRTFSAADIDLVQHVANQAGQLLIRKRTETELQHRAQEMAALYQTSLEINSQPDLQTLLDAIVGRAADLLRVHLGGLFLLQPDGETLLLAASYRMTVDPTRPNLRMGEGLAGRAAEAGLPLMISDYQSWEGKAVAYSGLPFRQILAVPLKVQHQVIGVLSLADDEAVGLFSDSQVRLASQFADQAATAIEKARLLDAERAARAQTEALREAAHVMGASLEVDLILRLILDQLRRVLVYDTASVLVLREGGVPDLIAGAGYKDGDFTSRAAGPMLQQSPILSQMACDLKPVVSGDVRHMEGWIWVPGAEHVRSWMGVPLVAHGRMIGALMVDHSEPEFFGGSELQVVQALAQHAAQALENARLFTERVRAERELQERRLYLEAVLASAPDAIITLDAQHRLVEWNPGAERLFGYSRDEVIGRNLDDLVTNSDTFEEAAAITQRVLSGKAVRATETVRYHKSGSPVDVLLAGSPILVDDELRGVVGVYTDISERKHAERALRKANRGLQMLSRSSEGLSRAKDEPGLLLAVCEAAVDVGGYQLAWVGFAEQDVDRTVRPVAQAGFAEAYLDTVHITWDDSERGRGPTGTAIRTGGPAIARNMLTDPAYAPWRDQATQRGYASSIALPLMAEEQAFGALIIYAAEPDAFDAEEVELLSELADNLAYGVVALRTRGERRRVEQTLRRYAERLETLHQIDRAIVEAQSSEAIARATLSRIGRLVPCRLARIVAFGSEADSYTVLAEHSSPGANPAQTDLHSGWDPAAGGAPIVISIPLTAQGELIGILHMESDKGSPFTTEQVEVAYEVGAPLAVAIQNARLHEQLRQHAGSLAETVAERTSELKAERDRTQAILESLGEAVIVADVAGTVLFTNPATAALTGFGSKEVLGQDCRMLQGNGHSAEVYGRVQAALAERQTWRGEMINRRKDGTAYDVAVTVTPLFAPEDSSRLVGSVWVERDITLLKEAERIKDQFVSNVSHELRTPLSVLTLVVGNLDRLYDRLADASRRKMVQSIREQVAVLNDLVGDVLEMSRIDSGQVSGERQQVDLALLVRGETDKQRPLARGKSQTLRVVGLERLILEGNEGQLRQVLRNLVNNGIKFTPDGGQITCECSILEGAAAVDARAMGLPPGRWAALRIVDDGIGIEQEDIPHLFERFFRVETQGNIPGTGLGLAITRELVELHQGHITVASTPGEGTTFAVFLPLPEEDHENERLNPGR